MKGRSVSNIAGIEMNPITMQTHENEAYVGTFVNIMHYFKIWSTANKQYKLSVFILIPSYLLFFILSGMEIYHNWGDLMSTTDAINTLVVFLATSHKYYKLISCEKQFKEAINVVEKDFFMPGQREDKEQATIIDKHYKEVKVITTFWVSACVITLSSIMLLPLAQGIIHINQSTSNETYIWKIPYRTWTPFDGSPGYIIAPLYIFHMYMGAIQITAIPAFDYIYITLVNHACAQLKILQGSIRNILIYTTNTLKRNQETQIERINDSEYDDEFHDHKDQTPVEPLSEINKYWAMLFRNRNSTINVLRNVVNFQANVQVSADYGVTTFSQEKLDRELQRRVASIVNHHERILNFVKQVEFVVNAVFLTQFVCSATLFCLTGFQITVNKTQHGRLLTMTELLVAAIFEMGMFCYYANRVRDESIFVGKAAYDSEWYLIKSKSFKKSISIIMARCNRPAKITFGKFADLSMDSFASILQISYSYFTVLTRINE